MSKFPQLKCGINLTAFTTLRFNSPWQLPASVAFPVQGIPPEKFLARFLVPIPHVAEHVPQEPHAAHEPSTENTRVADAFYCSCWELNWIASQAENPLSP